MATKSSARSSKRKAAPRAGRGKRVAQKAATQSRKTSLAKKKSASKSAKRPIAKSPAKRVTKKPVAKVASRSAAPRAAKPVVKSVLLKLVELALENMKAVNVTVLDVRGLTDVADNLVIASGNSDRHVKSIAENVVLEAKKAGYRPMGVEGERDGEWALVDLQDIIVHVMLPRVREFYRLENLWDISAARRESALNPA